MANEGRKGKRGFYANANEGRRRPAAAAVVRAPGPLPGRPTGPGGLGGDGPRDPGGLLLLQKTQLNKTTTTTTTTQPMASMFIL